MSLAKKIFESVAVKYRAHYAKTLGSYGLKYDDLLIETEDVMKGLSHVSPATRKERDIRLKRAYDLSAKKKTMYTFSEDPFDFYLSPEVEKAEARRQERELMNA